MALWVWLLVFFAGAMGQLIDAVAGMGFGAFSGSVMVAGGVSVTAAVVTISVAKIGSGLVSGVSHWRFGNVRWRWVAPLLVPGVLGGVLGAVLLTHLPQSVARVWVPSALLLMGALVLRQFLWRRVPVLQPVAVNQHAPVPVQALALQIPYMSSARAASRVQLGLIGFAAGALSGVSGAFGPVATTFVLVSNGEHPRYAIGTVNLVEFFVSCAVFATLLVRTGPTGFEWQLPAVLVAGSLLTAPLGAYLSKRLPAGVLGVAVGAVLIGINAWSLAKVLA